MYRADNEPVTFARDVDAIMVPAGLNVKLRQGQQGFITQALGGSFTVYVEGNLFRIAGKDADAIGKEMADVPHLPPNASDEDVRELAWQQMKTCYDPEIPINIVDLGLVYSCAVRSEPDGRVIDITMTLTAPGCGMGEVLVEDVRDKVEIIPTVKRADVRAGVRPAVEPVDDVRGRAAADGDDVSWVAVGPAAGIPPGDYAAVEVDGNFVAVFNIEGEFFAIDDVCTHDGGGLTGGALEDHQVICPRHGARFCLRTGAALTPPAYEPVRSYPTRVVDGIVEVQGE